MSQEYFNNHQVKMTYEKYEVSTSSWFKDNILGCVWLGKQEHGADSILPLATPRSTMRSCRRVSCVTISALLGFIIAQEFTPRHQAGP